MQRTQTAIFLLCVLAVSMLVEIADAKGPEQRKSRKQQREEKKQKQKEKKLEKERKEKAKKGEVSAEDRGLYDEHLTPSTILNGHDVTSPDRTTRNFRGDVLAYVTPWNNHGYDLAKWYRRFTHVAPVWYNIRINGAVGRDAAYIQGGHDCDQPWIEEVRGTKDPKPKIVPRFVFQMDAGWGLENIGALLKDRRSQKMIIGMIVQETKDKRFDGITLELFSQASGLLEDPSARKGLLAFIAAMADALHKEKKILVLAVPPPIHGSERGFSADDFDQLKDAVDKFSLVTYDFSPPGYRIGPNSPLVWVRHVLDGLLKGKNARKYAKKILAGVPFYGYDHVSNEEGKPGGGNAIIGGKVLELLDKYQPEIEWDDSAHEHYFKYTTATGQQHMVYFVTPKMIESRLAVAKELGVGVAIWDLGQGHDWLMDVL